MTDSDSAETTKFVNLLPRDVLASHFWRHVLQRDAPVKASAPLWRLPGNNLIRRALNNWDSSASGLELEAQPWCELVQIPLRAAVRRLQDEMEFRHKLPEHQVDDEIGLLQGEWRMFTGETIKIEASGHVRSVSDHGAIRKTATGIEINWSGRQLTDAITIGSDGRTFVTKNQYGDGGLAHRIDNF
jgi:hypothetical protein